MWQYKGEDNEPWTKIAVISPSDEKKRLPITHVAKDGGHYMPLISDTMQKPDYDRLENGSAWTTKGIQSMIKNEAKEIFRAGGEEEIEKRRNPITFPDGKGKRWRHHFKLIGKDKLRNEIGLSFSQLKMIEASLEKCEIDRKKRITDKKRRPIKGITKKECKARRLAGLRKRSVDIAINYGHSPLRLHAQKYWQSTACTNLVCVMCWKSSTNSFTWKQQCSGYPLIGDSHFPPSRAWRKFFINKIGAKKLFKLIKTGTRDQEMILDGINHYDKRRAEGKRGKQEE